METLLKFSIEKLLMLLFLFFTCQLLPANDLFLVDAQIGDKVWEDLDGNGLQDANEPGIDSILVELYACDNLDSPIATTFSNANGDYFFSELPAGNYIIKFQLPPFLNYTTKDQGNNDEIDSDVGDDGFTDCFAIGATDTILSVDAGFVPCVDQTTLFCNSLEIVAMDEDCEEEVLIDMVLEGDDLCWNLYDIEITWNGQSYGNMLVSDHVGDTVQYEVTHLPSGNTCDGELAVIDNLIPEIVQCDSVWITCGDPLHPDSVGGFAAFDNCGEVDLIFSDSIYPGTCDQPFVRKIKRSWEVTDEYDNTNSCVQFIFEQRPKLTDVVFPISLDGIQNPGVDCNGQSTHPDQTGWPTVNGKNIKSGDVCGFKAFYFDQTSPGNCESTLTILRTWTVLEVCSGEDVEKDQIIEVVDEVGPNIGCPEDILVGTSVNNCSADIFLPEVTYSDDCSSDDSVTVFVLTPFDTLFDNGGWLLSVPPGNFTATYVAVDACGNASTCSISIEVEDNVPPVGVVNQHLQAAVGQDGDAVICWSVFDDVSYDNCEVVAIKLKREDAPFNIPFTDCVTFECADVGDTVTVRVRVYDIEGTYTEDDPIGRFNEVTVEVTVKDALPPIIACPPHVTIDCWEDYEDMLGLSDNPANGYPVYSDSVLLGYYPAVFDNCGVDSVAVKIQDDVNNCGTGVISLVWTAFDINGNHNACIQNITLTPADPFYISDTDCQNQDPNDGVIWPCDYFVEECNAGTDPSITGEPILDDGFCELIGVDYEDTKVVVQDTACFKIVRDWLVVDWCQPDSTSPYGHVFWEYTQEIKVLDNTVPEILSDCESFTVCTDVPDCGETPVQLILNASDACTPFEDLNFIHTIDLFDNGNLDIQGTGNDASGLFPIGTHRIHWKVEDGCGNLTSCEYTFTIEDCKAPTPVCLNLSVPFNSSAPFVELPATAFDNGSSDNCTLAEDLLFSFGSDIADSIRVFSCDDLDDSLNLLLTLEIFVTDESGNQDFCTVSLSISDPDGVCDPVPTTALISGAILTDDQDPVNEVTVDLSSNAGGNILTALTDDQGQYSFQALLFQNYIITPFKNDDPVNGITTLDLVLINQHILGLDPLDSPYKIIAADASNDGAVTSFDLVEIRKLILQLTSEFSNNTSFRFVDKAYQFPNPSNPFFPPFPEVININYLEEDELEQDFVGVKIGDVNDSYAGLLQSSQHRKAEEISWFAQDQFFQKGEEVVVPVLATTRKESIKGLQWTLAFDPNTLVVKAIRSDLPGFNTENYSLHLSEEGSIPVSWIGDYVFTSDRAVIEVIFEAKRSGQLSDKFSINSDLIAAEAYVEKDGFSEYPLSFSIVRKGKIIEEDGNTTIAIEAFPNPFSKTTTLGIRVDDQTPYEMILSDVTGRIIYSEKGILASGFQTMILDKNHFPHTGLYILKMRTDRGEAISKLYFIE